MLRETTNCDRGEQNVMGTGIAGRIRTCILLIAEPSLLKWSSLAAFTTVEERRVLGATRAGRKATRLMAAEELKEALSTTRREPVEEPAIAMVEAAIVAGQSISLSTSSVRNWNVGMWEIRWAWNGAATEWGEGSRGWRWGSPERSETLREGDEVLGLGF